MSVALFITPRPRGITDSQHGGASSTTTLTLHDLTDPRARTSAHFSTSADPSLVTKPYKTLVTLPDPSRASVNTRPSRRSTSTSPTRAQRPRTPRGKHTPRSPRHDGAAPAVPPAQRKSPAPPRPPRSPARTRIPASRDHLPPAPPPSPRPSRAPSPSRRLDEPRRDRDPEPVPHPGQPAPSDPAWNLEFRGVIRLVRWVSGRRVVDKVDKIKDDVKPLVASPPPSQKSRPTSMALSSYSSNGGGVFVLPLEQPVASTKLPPVPGSSSGPPKPSVASPPMFHLPLPLARTASSPSSPTTSPLEPQRSPRARRSFAFETGQATLTAFTGARIYPEPPPKAKSSCGHTSTTTSEMIHTPAGLSRRLSLSEKMKRTFSLYSARSDTSSVAFSTAPSEVAPSIPRSTRSPGRKLQKPVPFAATLPSIPSHSRDSSAATTTPPSPSMPLTPQKHAKLTKPRPRSQILSPASPSRSVAEHAPDTPPWPPRDQEYDSPRLPPLMFSSPLTNPEMGLIPLENQRHRRPEVFSSESTPAMPSPSTGFSSRPDSTDPTALAFTGRPSYPRAPHSTMSSNSTHRRWTVAVAEITDDADFLRELDLQLGRERQRKARSELAIVDGSYANTSVGHGFECEPDELEQTAVEEIEEDPIWRVAKRVMLCVREIVRTERSYQRHLIRIHEGEHAPPAAPPLFLAHLPYLISASKSLTSRWDEDPSAWGVSAAFLGSEKELERTFVGWCGIVGEVMLSFKLGANPVVAASSPKSESASTSSTAVSRSASMSEDGHGHGGGSAIGHGNSGVSTSGVGGTGVPPSAGRLRWHRNVVSLVAKDSPPPMPSLPPAALSNNRRPTSPSSPAKRKVRPKTASAPSGSLHRRTSSKRGSRNGNREPRKLMSCQDVAIMPSQRVLRYVMLFRELLRHTPASSPSRPLVEKALEVAMRIAQLCDNAQQNLSFGRF